MARILPPARRGHTAARGQAVPELLAAIPIVLVAGLVAWQLVAALWAGILAQERVRADALGATGAPGRIVTVDAEVPVPAILPGLSGLEARARATVRTP